MIENYLIYIIIILTSLILLLKFSKPIFKFFLFLSIGMLLLVYVSGCSKGNLNVTKSMEGVEENTLTRIRDLPFVKKSEIDIEKSLVMGEGKSWSGQLSIIVPAKKTEVFNFYVNNIEAFGWKEQTTIRGETSILNYVGENNRVAIITIKELRFNNSEVLISVSPYAEEFEDAIGDVINEKYLELSDWKN